LVKEENAGVLRKRTKVAGPTIKYSINQWNIKFYE